MKLILSWMLINSIIALATAFGFGLSNKISQLPGLSHLFPKNPILQWTGASYNWPCATTKALFKKSGKYDSRHSIATRAQLSNENNLFIAVPRFKNSTPVTLARASLFNKVGACDATFDPFPCWSFQEEGNCQSLQSVVDIHLDCHSILWALDIGVVNSLHDPTRTCPPKVVAFNERNGRVIKMISLEGLVSEESRLQYLIVDYSSDGRVFLYISDAATRAIIVYDVQASRGFRVILPEAVACDCSKQDVLYLALVKNCDERSILYFNYLCAKRLFSIDTEYLRQGSAQGRIQDVGAQPARQSIIGTNYGSTILFRNEGETDVIAWDTNTCFKKENWKTVYKGDSCILATHAIPDYKRQKMIVLESNFIDYLKDTVGCGAIQQLSTVEGCF